MSAPPFAKPKPKCRQGSKIVNLSHLLATMKTSKSIWYAPAHHPVPSAFLWSWQARSLLIAVDQGQFFHVIRPTPTNPTIIPF